MFGPSRFVWFTIGSVATWAWMRFHLHHRHDGCPSARIGYDTRTQWESGAPYGSAGYGRSDQQQQKNAPWGWRQHTGAPADSRFDARAPSDVKVGGERQGSPVEAPRSPVVDQERERLRHMGRSAEEAVRVHTCCNPYFCQGT